MKAVGRHLLLIPTVLALVLGLGIFEVHAQQKHQAVHASLVRQARFVDDLHAASWSYGVVERGGSWSERCAWATRALTAARRAGDLQRTAGWQRVSQQDCARASGPDLRPVTEVPQRLQG